MSGLFKRLGYDLHRASSLPKKKQAAMEKVLAKAANPY